jgi:hypothetical protein
MGFFELAYPYQELEVARCGSCRIDYASLPSYVTFEAFQTPVPHVVRIGCHPNALSTPLTRTTNGSGLAACDAIGLESR